MFDSVGLEQYASSAWASFGEAATAPPLRLCADFVDLPPTAAVCDPMTLLGPELRNIMGDVTNLFLLDQLGSTYIASRAQAQMNRTTS